MEHARRRIEVRDDVEFSVKVYLVQMTPSDMKSCEVSSNLAKLVSFSKEKNFPVIDIDTMMQQFKDIVQRHGYEDIFNITPSVQGIIDKARTELDVLIDFYMDQVARGLGLITPSPYVLVVNTTDDEFERIPAFSDSDDYHSRRSPNAEYLERFISRITSEAQLEKLVLDLGIE